MGELLKYPSDEYTFSTAIDALGHMNGWVRAAACSDVMFRHKEIPPGHRRKVVVRLQEIKTEFEHAEKDKCDELIKMISAMGD